MKNLLKVAHTKYDAIMSGASIATRASDLLPVNGKAIGSSKDFKSILDVAFKNLMNDSAKASDGSSYTITYTGTGSAPYNYTVSPGTLGFNQKKTAGNWSQGAKSTWVANKATNGLKYTPSSLLTVAAAGKLKFYGGYMPVPHIVWGEYLYKMPPAMAVKVNNLYEVLIANALQIGDVSRSTNTRTTKTTEKNAIVSAIDTAVQELVNVT